MQSEVKLFPHVYTSVGPKVGSALCTCSTFLPLEFGPKAEQQYAKHQKMLVMRHDKRNNMGVPGLDFWIDDKAQFMLPVCRLETCLSIAFVCDTTGWPVEKDPVLPSWEEACRPL